MSNFIIEAVDLGELSKIVVKKTNGSIWCLNQVVVKKGAFAPKEDIFQYKKYKFKFVDFMFRYIFTLF